MARVPSLDTKDPLLGLLTGRQTVVVAVVGLLALGVYLALSRISWILAMAVAFPLVAVGAVAALAPKIDGLWGEQLGLLAAADHILPRRRVWTPSGSLPRLPRRIATLRERVGELRLPWRTLRPDGDLDLGRRGLVRILRATSLGLELRSEEERRGLVEAWRKLLNALEAPLQVVVSAEPVATPEIALSEGPVALLAEDHRELLASYRTRTRRRARVVLRAASREALDALAREVESRLSAIGVRTRALSKGETAALLGSCAGAPPGTTRLLPAEGVERRPRSVVHPEWVRKSFAVVGWPSETEPGFLQPILSHPGPVDVAVLFDPTGTAEAARRLHRLRRRLAVTRTLGNTDPEIEVAHEDAAAISRDLVRGATRLVRVSLAATVTAASEEEADAEARRLLPRASGLLLDLRPTTFRAIEGWVSTMPLALELVGCSRTMDTAPAADLLPLATGEVEGHPTTGVLVGENLTTGTPVFVDRWALPGPNALVLAPTGVGKSFLARLLSARSVLMGEELMVIDPSLDRDWAPLIEALGGRVTTDPQEPPSSPVHCWQVWGADRRERVAQALATAWGHATSDGRRRRQLVIDEGHLATRESPATALLWEVVKEGRHASLGTTIVTQDYKDVVSSDFGEPLLTNCATVVLLRQEPKQVAHLVEAFGLSQGEGRFLRSAVAGKILGDGRVIPAEALLLAGNERCAIRVVSTALERRLLLGGTP